MKRILTAAALAAALLSSAPRAAAACPYKVGPLGRYIAPAIVQGMTATNENQIEVWCSDALDGDDWYFLVDGYSYVGRRRAISYRRGHHLPGAGCRSAASSARRGAAAGRGLSSVQRRRGAISYRRGIIEPPRKSRPRKTGSKKEVGAAAGRVYLFFRVILPGCRPGRAAGIHRGPFFPAWRSQYTPPRFPRRIVPPFSLARILPASIALQLS